MTRELPIVIFGLTQAAVYALLALGLVMTFRVSKFLNLGHGALGMFVTYVYWQLASQWGWPVFLSAVVAIGIVAPMIGWVLSSVLFRRVTRRPETARIAATVAVIIVVNELAVRIWGGVATSVPSVMPRKSVRLAGAVIGAEQLLTIAVAGAVALLVHILLSRAELGRRMRAVAESRELAGSFGINVRRVEAQSWAGGTMLAGLAGILIAPLSVLTPGNLTFLVVSALAAVTLGHFVSIRGTLIGAGVLGIAGAELARLPSTVIEKYGSVSSGVPFALLVVAVFFYGRERREVGSGEDASNVSSSRGFIPRDVGALRLFQEMGRSRRARSVRLPGRDGLVIVVSGAAVISFAGVLSGPTRFTLTLVAIWTVVFASMSLLNGLGGQVSLCQGTFMGVGGLVAARVQAHCIVGAGGRPECSVGSGSKIWVGVVVAGVVGVLVGVVVAAGTTKLRGVLLAIATLSFGFFMDNTVFTSFSISHGSYGYPVGRPPGFTSSLGYFGFCVGWAVIALLLIRNLARSASGRALRLAEQSPVAAEALGYRRWAYKLVAFGLASGIAGVGGYLFAAALGQFSSFDFSTFTSLVLFVVVFAVGTRLLWSPVVAAVAYVYVPKLMGGVDALADWSTLVFGLGAIAALGLTGGITAAVSGRVSSLSQAAKSRGGRRVHDSGKEAERMRVATADS